MIEKPNCIILTGAPGSGKTTLLACLREREVQCIDEPARQILAEQRLINGNGVPEESPAIFVDLMLSRTTHMFQTVESSDGLVLFDRGLADNIAYAALFELSFERGWNAAKAYRFNPTVFFAPNWPKIYRTDDERTMSYELSASMGDNLRTIYQQLGYTIIDLPLRSLQERVEFVLGCLNQLEYQPTKDQRNSNDCSNL